MSESIAVIGGGPGGLYFAALAKQLDPARRITVYERNSASTTFGFGVVFSDETLDGIAGADPIIFARMQERFARWSDIDVHYRDEIMTSGGHGFAAIERQSLLKILQERCATLQIDVQYQTSAPPADQLAREHDLVVAADGLHSVTRNATPALFGARLDERHCRYMWLATEKVLEAFTFIVSETEFGPMQVHAYPFSEHRSTFIVEMNESTWCSAGFNQAQQDTCDGGEAASIRVLEGIFKEQLDGHQLLSNNSRWIRFSTVRNRTWSNGNIVLLGDAAHTAHFSIGSGTKLAMEDSLALVYSLSQGHADIPAALAEYENQRRPVVESTQRAAQASLEWFESIGHLIGQPAPQFAFNLLTRSRRVTYNNLAERDPAYAEKLTRWFQEESNAANATAGVGTQPARPMFDSFRLRELELSNRIVAAPITTYQATDGVPSDVELVRLTSMALGGAGLVFTGMTAVKEDARVTPSCPGLYSPEQIVAHRRITDLIHAQTRSAVGVQLNHAGPKGATHVPVAGTVGPPVDSSGWRAVAASAVPYGTLPVPRGLELDELPEIVEQFAAAARAAEAAGFDVLELQAGHGFLLSTFLSPLTNRRSDHYGGALDARLRFPLEVFDAVRAAWPADKPVIVRISAVDWYPGGTTIEDAVAIAQAFSDHGADAIDVSSGEVVAGETPQYGRGYQTPFAERIRAEVEIPTIAVGAISSEDDANSVLLAGRADLIGVGRALLHDPAWTLHAAADVGHSGQGVQWPAVYAAGSTKPPASGRARPQLQLYPEAPPEIHQRWTPHQQPTNPLIGE